MEHDLFSIPVTTGDTKGGSRRRAVSVSSKFLKNITNIGRVIDVVITYRIYLHVFAIIDD